jgi:hypothetical protein
MQLSKINILIFNVYVFYGFQPEGSIRIEHTLLPTGVHMPMHAKRTHTVTAYTVLFKMIVGILTTCHTQIHLR